MGNDASLIRSGRDRFMSLLYTMLLPGSDLCGRPGDVGALSVTLLRQKLPAFSDLVVAAFCCQTNRSSRITLENVPSAELCRIRLRSRRRPPV